ncbi:MAG: hypothetical protein Kow0056_00500 [Coriobacteriia bacterium]
MVRINLIPPEITERRATESRVSIMILAFIVVLLVMVGFWLVMAGQVGSKRKEVAAAEQRLQEVQAEAERLKVFEETVSDLEKRQQIADQVLEGRIQWSRLCEEISLVLPDDAWLNSMQASEENGLALVGRVLDYQDDAPDSGHKAIARMLVRLTDLEQLDNVWLTSSVKAGPQEDYEESWLDVQISAQVHEPAPEEDSAGGPAPPTQSQ